MRQEQIQWLAGALATVLLFLAAIHLAWVVRGSADTVTIPTRTNGSALFQPGPGATLAVAMLLTTSACLVLMRAGLFMFALPFRLPAMVVTVGTWTVAVAFAARAIGEFRYVGLFRRVHDTPFAKWDARLFTPLCCVLAIGTAFVAAS